MNKIILFIIAVFIGFNVLAQKTYKAMMNDNSINFYDVCKEAENYFEKHEKGKGSGWKGFQRWSAENEFKYYPSGDRSNIDPYFTKKQYEGFLSKNPNDKTLFPNGWVELGPTTPGQITGHYSFGMGRIKSFYVDPNNTQRLYLGTRTGGFWKSLDGGATWAGTSDFLTASGVTSIAASPTNPDSVLINVNNSRNHATHGIHRSIDGGNTWTLSNFNPTNLGWGGLGSNGQIYKIKIHPTIPNLIFIGTNNGLYRSTDNLATWTVPVANDDFTDIDFHPTNPNIVYAYANNQPNVVYVSTNAGVSFSTTALPGSAGNTGKVAVSPSCPNCVYYLSGNGVWKSTDSGGFFSLVSNPGVSHAGFAVSDLNDNNILAGYVDASFSTDGGLNFNQVTSWSLGSPMNGTGNFQTNYNTSTRYIHADLQAAECSNGVFYACTDGFLVKSADNGVSWTKLSEDIGIRMNYNLGVSQSNHSRTICGSQDNGTSVNTENGWVEMTGADGMEGFIHPLNDDWMIGSWQNGSRRRTFNGGQTNGGATPPGQNANWIAPMFYDPNEQMRVYSFGENVHRSNDFGNTWTNVGTPSFTGSIQFATIAENNSNILLATKSSNIEMSINGGISWTSIKGNLPNYSITDVVFDPNDDNTIVVTYARYQLDNSKVFITHNQGATWQNITYNLGNMPVRSVVIDYTDASTIYLGTEIGVYKKKMLANTWSLHNPNLPNTAIMEMEIMRGTNTLRASTWGRGLWEYTVDGRLNHPAIVSTRITDQPTEEFPKIGDDQFVTSKISYDNTLSSVYLEWSVNVPVFGNVITMSNTIDSTWVSDVALPNQSIGTKMYFKVYALGSAGDTTETYKFMYTVKQDCISSGTMQWQGNINLVNFNTINKSTGKTAPYSNYYTTDTTEVILGQAYDLSVKLNTDNGNYTYNSTAWIDWNNDGDFLDTNETYQLGSVQNDSNALTSLSPLNINVPVNAFIGKIRMRVVCLYNQVQTDPCANGFDGEVEDYGLVIQNMPTNEDAQEVVNSLILAIFPNPTRDVFTVKLNKIVSSVKVELINPLGQIIVSKSVENKNEIRVNIERYAKGVYFLNIYMNKEKSIFKIIKK